MATFIKFIGTVDREKEKKINKINKRRKKYKLIINILKYGLITIMFLAVIKILFLLDSILCEFIKAHGIQYNQNYFEIINNLFTIQATLSTLTITFISIFSGFIKEKIYGVYLTDYIFNKKSKVNLYEISITLIFLTFIYFIFLINSAYIICILIFLITIILIAYIMKKAFYLMSNYQKIEEEILDYIKNTFKDCLKYIRNINSNEENINYLLEENYKYKKYYYVLDNIICNLYSDTIEKINSKDFNNYQKNIRLYQALMSSFDCENINLLTKDVLETLMQRVNALIDTLISNKTIFAIYLMEFKSQILMRNSYKKDLSCESKKNLIQYFDNNYYIEKLCLKLDMTYYFKDSYNDNILSLIKSQQYKYLYYIESYLFTNDYSFDELYNEIQKLFALYIVSIKSNKYFTKNEKNLALSKLEKNSNFWKDYLNYDSIQFLRETSSNAEIISKYKDDTNYLKIETEMNKIKERLKIDIEKLMDVVTH